MFIDILFLVVESSFGEFGEMQIRFRLSSIHKALNFSPDVFDDIFVKSQNHFDSLKMAFISLSFHKTFGYVATLELM